MRVLLLTPYSPLLEHDHAAADIAAPMVEALGAVTELHVVAADGQAAGERAIGDSRAHFHAAPDRTVTAALRRLAPYPYRLRLTWTPSHTTLVERVVRELRPDVVHMEYLQPAEAALSIRGPLISATWHDVTHRVAAVEAERECRAARAAYLRWEALLLRRTERRLARRADTSFVFSERDRREVELLGGTATIVNMGLEDPTTTMWEPDVASDLVFAGALWRGPNILTARFLADEVMPLVWNEEPSVRLRIVGARPAPEVTRLAADPRVEVHADVPSLDPYLATAALNLAPSVVDAGILLKALRAMSIGAPVLLNSQSATPIDGLVAGTHAVVADSPASIAAEVIGLLRDRRRAAAMGSAGRELVLSRYSWRRYAESLVTQWARRRA